MILLAEHYQRETEPVQKSSSHNTCTEVPDYTSLFSELLSLLLPLAVCACARVTETEKDREILGSMKLNLFFLFLSVCLSFSRTQPHKNRARQKASPPATQYTRRPVTVVNRTGHV